MIGKEYDDKKKPSKKSCCWLVVGFRSSLSTIISVGGLRVKRGGFGLLLFAIITFNPIRLY